MQPREIALAIVQRSGLLLVTSATDPVSGRVYARPPGGGIEPGETPADATVREVAEELGLQALDPVPLGTLEARYRFAGKERHEIMHAVKVRLAAEAKLPAVTDAGHPVSWLDPRDCQQITLLPAGIAELLCQPRDA